MFRFALGLVLPSSGRSHCVLSFGLDFSGRMIARSLLFGVL